MRSDQDKEKASKSGIPFVLSPNYLNSCTDASGPRKTLQRPFFTATRGRNPMLARGDEDGRATIRNARLARRFRAMNYELATSFELARCIRDSTAAYAQ